VVLPLWVVENRPSPLLWPLAYTTACTTVQAVIYTLKTSPRVALRACLIGGSCTNCGVSRTTNGLCSRCLSLPYCKKCKRHLNQSSFNGEQRHICQVHLQIGLFLHVAITCVLHTATDTLQIGLLFHKSLSLSLHVLSSVYAYRTVKSGAPYDVQH